MDVRKVAAVALLGACALVSRSAAASAAPGAVATARLQSLPTVFEANTGQAAAEVKYLARGGDYALLLKADEVLLALYGRGDDGRLQAQLLSTRLVAARAQPSLQGEQALASTSRYFHGGDATQAREAAHYARVRYSEVYPGVDLVYHGRQGVLEYDFELAPGADPARIRLSYRGGKRLSLDAQGNLRIATAIGDVVQQKPVSYQTIGGRRVPVQSRFEVRGDEVGFVVGHYDHTQPLVIDPLLNYKIYVPGVSVTIANAVAVNNAGEAYVAGYAPATNWLTGLPIVGSLVDAIVRYEAFVAKISADGGTLEYISFYGGSDDEEVNGIALDAAGNAYLTGYTRSNDFPLKNPLQGAKGGYADAYALELSADGKQILFSTYLGGNSDDVGSGIAVDSAGRISVAGYTTSENFPTANAWQGASGGGSDGFVAKLDPTAGQFVYSSFFGGSDYDVVTALASDTLGNTYIVGNTHSADLPVQSAFQSTLTPPTPPNTYQQGDAFAAKFSADGQTLMYSTYLGGDFSDAATAVAVDGAGSAYIAGVTTSGNFPLQSAFQSANRYYDGFVTKLSPAGDALVYSTYLGGSSSDTPTAIAVDASGSAIVAGQTYSTNFPMRLALQGANSGSGDLFLSKFTPTGNGLVFSTFLGANGREEPNALALDSAGNAYVVGRTFSSNYPVKNPIQGGSFKGGETFVSKFAANGQSLGYSTYLGSTMAVANLVVLNQGANDPAQGIPVIVPFRGLIGCTLRALPSDLIGRLTILFPSHVPCGDLPPAP